MEEIIQIPVGKAKDITNQKFGRLTALYRVKSNNDRTKWLCRCDCGKEVVVMTTSLTTGHTQSCGCYKTDTIVNDLTGQKFGMLTALYPLSKTTKTGEYVKWHCLCDCGKYHDVSSKCLVHGNTTSCGCQGSYKDLTGQKFGMLTALQDTGRRNKHRRAIWKCKCDCGKIIEVSSQNLLSFGTMSCGCLSSSEGENIIENILKNNNIIYEKEKRFDTCFYSNKNNLARFDFFVDNKYCIEFDGKQHFKENTYFEFSLKEIQLRDNNKNQWCKDNNIPLIRIPYTHINKICLEDLLLETTTFRVV